MYDIKYIETILNDKFDGTNLILRMMYLFYNFD
jgi:hypothetical protein